jgi:hypothetical protein
MDEFLHPTYEWTIIYMDGWKMMLDYGLNETHFDENVSKNGK